jgi:hypothetical protein
MALAVTTMKLRIPLKANNTATCYAVYGFSRRILDQTVKLIRILYICDYVLFFELPYEIIQEIT